MPAPTPAPRLRDPTWYLLGWGLLTAWGLVGSEVYRPSVAGAAALQSTLGSATSLAACLVLALAVWRIASRRVASADEGPVRSDNTGNPTAGSSWIVANRWIIAASACAVTACSTAAQAFMAAGHPVTGLVLQGVSSFAYIALMGLWFLAYAAQDPEVVENRAVWSTALCAAVVTLACALPQTASVVLRAMLPLASGALLLVYKQAFLKHPAPCSLQSPALPGSNIQHQSRRKTFGNLASIAACGLALALPADVAGVAAAGSSPLFVEAGKLGGLALAAAFALGYVTSARRIDLSGLFKALYPVAGLSLFLTALPQGVASALGVALGTAGQWALYVLIWVYAAELHPAAPKASLLRFVMTRAPFDAGTALAGAGALAFFGLAGTWQAPEALTYLLFGTLALSSLAYGFLPAMETAGPSVPASGSPQNLGDLVDSRSEQFATRYGLSERESQILLRILRGYSTAAIRNELAIAKGTVDTHIQRIYRKCGVHSRQELVELAETPEKPRM